MEKVSKKDDKLEHYKIPESIHTVDYFNFVINPETLHAKIEPLISVQASLINTLAEFNKITEPVKKSIVRASDVIGPLSGTIQALGLNLAEVSKVALKTDDLLKLTTYDFVKSPMASALNVATDAIKINQDRISSVLPCMQDIFGLAKIDTSNQISQISALNSLAIGSLQSSDVLFPVFKTKEKDSDIREKIEKLELKIDQLENKNENLVLTDITSNITKILEGLDSDIADCFKGAITTLLEDKSEDLVGQVAESLTRVIEKLPFALSKKQVYSSNDKENNVIEALLLYLDIPKEEYKSDHLVMQQKSFYSILGNIRHRKSRAYKLYNKNKKLFKAFVMQIEAYIYILVTLKNEK